MTSPFAEEDDDEEDDLTELIFVEAAEVVDVDEDSTSEELELEVIELELKDEALLLWMKLELVEDEVVLTVVPTAGLEVLDKSEVLEKVAEELVLVVEILDDDDDTMVEED